MNECTSIWVDLAARNFLMLEPNLFRDNWDKSGNLNLRGIVCRCMIQECRKCERALGLERVEAEKGRHGRLAEPDRPRWKNF